MTISRIEKHQLAWVAAQSISLPAEKSLLHIGILDGHICLWCAVDPETPRMNIEICMVSDKQKIPNVGSFLGTAITGFGFAWHVFTGPGDEMVRGNNFHYQTKGN